MKGRKPGSKVIPEKTAVKTSQPDIPKDRPVKLDNNAPARSFEASIVRFHYCIVILFLTLLLIYDLTYFLCERASPLFNYLRLLF